MDDFVFYPDDSEILSISSFKYFRVIRMVKKIHSFVFRENQCPDNFVPRSTDLIFFLPFVQQQLCTLQFFHEKIPSVNITQLKHSTYIQIQCCNVITKAFCFDGGPPHTTGFINVEEKIPNHVCTLYVRALCAFALTLLFNQIEAQEKGHFQILPFSQRR